MWQAAPHRPTRTRRTPRGWAGIALAGAGLVSALASPAAPAPDDDPPLRLCGTDAQQVPAPTWLAAGLHPDEADLSRDAFLAALITQATGLPLRVVYMQSWRCIQEAAAGHVDGVMAISALPQRQALLSFPQRDGQLDRERRLNTFAYHWYVRRDEAWEFAPPKKLSGPRKPTVGYVAGYSVATLLEGDGYRTEPIAGGTLTALRMVARSRLDVAVLLDTETQPALDKDPDLAQRLQQLTPPYTVRDYYLVFSPDTVARRPDAVHRLWAALPQVRESTRRLLGSRP